jgi:peptidoglycan/LPS O-acetylase OafA/YrhL
MIVRAIKVGALDLSQQDHYSSLDGLRGFAAVSVVLFHLGHWLGVPMLATNSYLAVDLFFCLSGFVLPLAYGHREKPDLPAKIFFKIRLIRLMPLIVIATLISGIYVVFRMMVTHHQGELHSVGLAMFLGVLTLPYLHAPEVIGGPQVFPLNGPQYTLFLEFFINVIWFYGRRIAPMISSLTIAALCTGVIAMIGGGGDSTATFWHGFPRVGASFFIGVALFEIQHRFRISDHIKRIFWPLCLVMAALFYFPLDVGRAGLVVWMAVIAPGLVLSGSKISMSDVTRRLCLFGGDISYPIYVLQYPIFCWANGIFQTVFHRQIALVEVPVIFMAILGLSYLTMTLYDQPARRAISRALRPRMVTAPPSLTTIEPIS